MAKNNHPQITLLDGGMGRELLRMGAPFQQPEWSAIALMEAPGLVKKAHESFAAAGSDVLTTCNYAVVPFHIGEKRFSREGAELTTLSGKLTRQVASTFGCKVAGSLPPLFGSYRPDLFISDQAPALLKKIINALDPFVDLWLAETTSSIREAQAVAEALSDDQRPLWISFTLLDSNELQGMTPRLRSNEKVSSAIRAAIELDASAVLFNCCQPETMTSAVAAAIQELECLEVDRPIGVYANAFPAIEEKALANSSLNDIRRDLDPMGYMKFVEKWYRRGATIIGGCCGIGPEHIAMLNEWRKTKP